MSNDKPDNYSNNSLNSSYNNIYIKSQENNSFSSQTSLGSQDEVCISWLLNIKVYLLEGLLLPKAEAWWGFAFIFLIHHAILRDATNKEDYSGYDFKNEGDNSNNCFPDHEEALQKISANLNSFNEDVKSLRSEMKSLKAEIKYNNTHQQECFSQIATQGILIA